MFGFIADIQPSKKKMLLDLLTFRKELEKKELDLVPLMDVKELALVSLTDIDFKKWGLISKVYKGAFTTIFHEIAFVYSIKDYFAASKRRVIYVKFAEHEIDYLTRGKYTEVFIDRTHVGSITDEGVMYNTRKRKVLARITQEDKEYQDIYVGDIELAMMLNPDLNDKFNPRAFELLKELNRDQTILLLLISIYEIIKKVIINKKIEQKK